MNNKITAGVLFIFCVLFMVFMVMTALSSEVLQDHYRDGIITSYDRAVTPRVPYEIRVLHFTDGSRATFGLSGKVTSFPPENTPVRITYCNDLDGFHWIQSWKVSSSDGN